MLHELLYILFLTLVVIYADRKMTAHNWNVKWNGLGSIDSVLAGTAMLPMQHRVLVPWLVGTLSKIMDRNYAYVWMRNLSILFAILCSFKFFMISGANPYIATGCMALYFILAAIYDYTDIYIEISLFSIFFIAVVNPIETPWVLLFGLVTFLASLNREVSILMPITTFIAGDITLGCVSMVGFWIAQLLVRVKYGKPKRYCESFMFNRNITTLKNSIKSGSPILYNEYTFFFVILFSAIGLYWFNRNNLTPIEISMGLLFVMLLVPTMWREIRVFAPCMLAIIPMAVRSLQ